MEKKTEIVHVRLPLTISKNIKKEAKAMHLPYATLLRMMIIKSADMKN